MADLVRSLQNIVGAEHVQTDGGGGGYAVDGVPPAAVVFPGSVEEVSGVLKRCSESGAAVVPWGGGSSMGLGRVPARVDVVLALRRLNRVIDHEPGDMTSSVQAGMVLADYQAALGRQGQFLALDPPAADRASLGGILAANTSGPHRLRYGTARDLLIGVRVAHADGTVVKGGAKVVKNVTGYDMNKLHVGALGTLGIIVEATFRLYPLPATEQTWLAAFPTIGQARAAVARLLDSSIVPAALEILNSAAAREVERRTGLAFGSSPALLAVAVASIPEAVAAQLRQAQEMGRSSGGEGGEMLEGNLHARFWSAVRDFGLEGDPGMILKAGVVRARGGEAIELGERQAAEQGLEAEVVSEAGTGIIRYHLRASGAGTTGRLAKVVSPLRDFAVGARGSLVVLQAPPEVKALVDVWGSPGDGFSLMQGLKQTYDPARILNPGRFVGGL